MHRLAKLFLIGTLLACGNAPVCADEPRYRQAGREHPFVALEAHPKPQTADASNEATGGFVLVGTIGQGDQYHALIRFPQGSVGRLRTGDRLPGTSSVLVEVNSTAAHIESVEGLFTLSLEMPRELPE